LGQVLEVDSKKVIVPVGTMPLAIVSVSDSELPAVIVAEDRLVVSVGEARHVGVTCGAL
jgi:hypothetical protein